MNYELLAESSSRTLAILWFNESIAGKSPAILEKLLILVEKYILTALRKHTKSMTRQRESKKEHRRRKYRGKKTHFGNLSM